ncbi:hypothetical protein FH972_005840 [Carpinus fangiana]|uniref:CTP synthase N-terminal domain-containing protein n=1 Tax=Carpinus fangiana TaxID=176857 RepID=A0A5N6QTZ7_9ROSI|nr:hypothetical protein FH972_005840 [Carpinus fangiana]
MYGSSLLRFVENPKAARTAYLGVISAFSQNISRSVINTNTTATITRAQSTTPREREMKYVLVTGGVVSGLGKGVTASSIGVVLKACGLRVTSIKIGPLLPPPITSILILVLLG